jgi:ABC-type polysaccharide transport system, permease component
LQTANQAEDKFEGVSRVEVLTKGQKRKKGNHKRYIPLFLMMIPGLLYLLINNYIPMIGLFIAFKNINFQLGFFESPWAGLQNFKYLFASSNAFIITRNTLLYNTAFIIIDTTAAITLAILLNEITKKIVMRIYQTVILMPYLFSMVIVSYLVYALLSVDNGFIDKSILPLFGMEPISWYSEPLYWIFILPLAKLWNQAGFLCIVYLASIVGIDKEYYEAAKLDGASKWKQIQLITLPLIKPVVIIMVLFSIGKIFYSDFGLFYQIPLNSGALYPTTNVIDTYVYRGLLQLGDIGMSSAAGFYQSIVGFILVLVSNLVVRKVSPENALF